jgi:itaconyl-CoA hydratase/mesaconyl-C4 CoA hydratase
MQPKGDGLGTSSLAAYIEGWRPEGNHQEDFIGPGPVEGLSAMFDLPRGALALGEELPPLWHWLYFLEWPSQSALGEDGHPREGQFLPPLPMRRRVAAGGRLDWHGPLRLGSTAERDSEVSNVVVKRGRSGEMVVVTVSSDYRQAGALCAHEEQDFIYRSGEGTRNAGAQGDPSSDDPAEDADPWQLRMTVDAALLFRMSALTANTHRIHYDAPYARDVEGYPGLVVHGPLQALAMLGLARRHVPEGAVERLEYRFQRPAFAGRPLLIVGRPTDGEPSGHNAVLRVLGPQNIVHSEASVTWRSSSTGCE